MLRFLLFFALITLTIPSVEPFPTTPGATEPKHLAHFSLTKPDTLLGRRYSHQSRESIIVADALDGAGPASQDEKALWRSKPFPKYLAERAAARKLRIREQAEDNDVTHTAVIKPDQLYDLRDSAASGQDAPSSDRDDNLEHNTSETYAPHPTGFPPTSSSQQGAKKKSSKLTTHKTKLHGKPASL
ncbi:hypothetical protein AcV5_005575 [Taiwanofungus camphoratus]|nr:hypothetical protein AcV5_005575 [Antrodia cinnamomea]